MIKQIFWRGQVFLRLTLPLVTDHVTQKAARSPAPCVLCVLWPRKHAAALFMSLSNTVSRLQVNRT